MRQNVLPASHLQPIPVRQDRPIAHEYGRGMPPVLRRNGTGRDQEHEQERVRMTLAHVSNHSPEEKDLEEVDNTEREREEGE